jgi:LPXTG-motif cell wall-anchored protein
MALAAAFVCMTVLVSVAQQTTTSTESKSFEVLGVDGNQLIVRLPEGTRELTVADDFRFIVNGKPLSVSELKAGMKGTATITTRTTVTPVTVTEVKNGTVVQRSGDGIVVRTNEGVRRFSQGEVDKRGVKIMRGGKPALLSEFREGDKLTATIVTSAPPRVMTEKEVQATVPTTAAAPAAAKASAPAAQSSAPAAQSSAARAPASAPVAQAQTAETLPKTASSWPVLWLVIGLLLAIGLVLTFRRRLVR